MESLKKLVQQYQSSESIEIQTRSLEYTAIGALSPMDRFFLRVPCSTHSKIINPCSITTLALSLRSK